MPGLEKNISGNSTSFNPGLIAKFGLASPALYICAFTDLSNFSEDLFKIF